MHARSMLFLAFAGALLSCKDGGPELTAEQKAKLPIVVYYELPG